MHKRVDEEDPLLPSNRTFSQKSILITRSRRHFVAGVIHSAQERTNEDPSPYQRENFLSVENLNARM